MIRLNRIKDFNMDDFSYNHIVLKVEDGTTMSGDSPCKTCRYGVKIRGVGNQLIRGCSNYAIASDGMKILPFEVAECNQYINKCVPTLAEMEELAWIVKTDAKKNGIGFMSPEDSRRIEKKRPRDMDF